MKDIEKLVRFCGYGNYDSANVIFLGNEEGLGGGEIEGEVRKRIEDYWNHGTALDGRSNENGYYVKGNGGGNARGHFLLFSARLMLWLNDQSDGDYYFKTQAEDYKAFDTIRNYKMDTLYNEEMDKFDYRSALLDLRPLPRAQENMMYSLYEKIDKDFNWQQYKKAFQFNSKRVDDYHLYLRGERARILQNIFNRDVDIRVIIGIGAKADKRRFFEEYFEFEMPFEDRKLSKNKVELFCGKLRIGNRIIPVFLADFFQGGFGIGLEGLKILSDLIWQELNEN